MEWEQSEIDMGKVRIGWEGVLGKCMDWLMNLQVGWDGLVWCDMARGISGEIDDACHKRTLKLQIAYSVAAYLCASPLPSPPTNTKYHCPTPTARLQRQIH